MKYSELIQLYFERSNALQGYWTLYVVIIGGLLAFSSLRQRKDLWTASLITVLFCFFAHKNLGAIHDVTEQRLAVLHAIHEAPVSNEDSMRITQSREFIEPTLNPPEYDGIRNFHIASDALTLACLWTMELRRWRKPAGVPNPPPG